MRQRRDEKPKSLRESVNSICGTFAHQVLNIRHAIPGIWTRWDRKPRKGMQSEALQRWRALARSSSLIRPRCRHPIVFCCIDICMMLRSNNYTLTPKSAIRIRGSKKRELSPFKSLTISLIFPAGIEKIPVPAPLKFLRKFRSFAASSSNSRLTETTVPDNLAPKTRMVSRARFRAVRCAAYRGNLAGLGGERIRGIARCACPPCARSFERCTSREQMPPRGLVLEVASGSGEHVAHFAQSSGPDLIFQPSDPRSQRPRQYRRLGRRTRSRALSR